MQIRSDEETSWIRLGNYIPVGSACLDALLPIQLDLLLLICISLLEEEGCLTGLVNTFSHYMTKNNPLCMMSVYSARDALLFLPETQV